MYISNIYECTVQYIVLIIPLKTKELLSKCKQFNNNYNLSKFDLLLQNEYEKLFMRVKIICCVNLCDNNK